MILNSPYISGSLTVTGNTNLMGALTVTGSLAGTATSSSFAFTASSAVSAFTAASAVNATTALTASYATSFTVGGTLTAQTLVVQTITSSVSFITGSTRFGSLLTNTHDFTGSVRITGSSHTIFGNLGVGGAPNETFSVTGPTGSQGFIRWTDGVATSGFLGINGRTTYIHANNNLLSLGGSTSNVFSPTLTISGSRVGIGITSSLATFHVSASYADTLGRVARFSTLGPSASIDFAHALNGGSIGYGAAGSGDLANSFFVTTGAGTVGSGIVMNNAGHVGFGTSNVTESVQASGTISIITNSSVSSGPLIQFSGNGRIRPASSGDRLSIDGNALYLNNFIGGTIITNLAGGGFSIGRSDAPSALNISGSTNGSTPVVDIKANGAGSFLRGVRMLNNTMTAGSSLMYATGYADGPRNMGQTYFYFAGDGSTSNRISMGLHSVDDVFNITGGGSVGIGTTGPTKPFQVNAAVANEVAQFNNTRNNGSGDYAIVTTLGASDNNTSNYHLIAATGGADKFYIYGNGTYTTVSDQRLKKNITTVTNTYLDKINALRIVNYNWNDQEEGHELELGMIAQEVEAQIPNIVYEGREHEDGVKYKGIQVSSLPYILIKAIQELKAELDELKNK